ARCCARGLRGGDSMAGLDRAAPFAQVDPGRRVNGSGSLAVRGRCQRPAARPVLCRKCEYSWLQSTSDCRAVWAGLMKSRVIIITGANGGLGQAIARAFLAESA